MLHRGDVCKRIGRLIASRLVAGGLIAGRLRRRRRRCGCKSGARICGRAGTAPSLARRLHGGIRLSRPGLRRLGGRCRLAGAVHLDRLRRRQRRCSSCRLAAGIRLSRLWRRWLGGSCGLAAGTETCLRAGLAGGGGCCRLAGENRNGLGAGLAASGGGSCRLAGGPGTGRVCAMPLLHTPATAADRLVGRRAWHCSTRRACRMCL